jgi:hypothetical protein
VLLVAAKDLDAGVRRIVGERPLDRRARSAFRNAGPGYEMDLAHVGVVGGREAFIIGRGDEVPPGGERRGTARPTRRRLAGPRR